MNGRARTFGPPLLAAAIAAGALAAAPEAKACGGFFCSSTPIDQTAEHILFTINGDHTVTGYIQISYTGDRDSFAWIIPAPSQPRLNVGFPQLAMQALDNATQPQYRKNSCNTFRGGVEDAAGGSPPPPTQGPGVTVVAHQNVGPYETVTLQGTGAEVLVDWLQKNGYRITDGMIPFIQPYVEGGSMFVAMKLLPDADVSDIQPLEMTYDSDKPMIPLRLTTVAAQPEMGIVTFILADRRWGPENYVDLHIDDELIEFDQYGYQSNYLTVVSREADKVGGQAFVTEYAKPVGDLVTQIEQQSVNPNIPDAQTARDQLLSLFGRFPYLTRLYTRMSAEEMTEDPIFMVAGHQEQVDNIHDLTEPGFDYTKCTYPTDPPTTNPCTFSYCGRRGVCVGAVDDVMGMLNGTAAPVPACVCAGDATARITTTANGQPQMYCEPLKMDLDAAPAAGSGANAPLFAAACESFSCGDHGECVGMNGNPTCRCEPGYGAVAGQLYDQVTGTTSATATCLYVGSSVPALPRLPPVGQTQMPHDGGMSQDSGACSVTAARSSGTRRGAPAALVLALGALAAGARRRRAR